MTRNRAHPRTTDDQSFIPTCPSCRYSLEGLPDGPCPECGRPFVRAALEAALSRRRRHARSVTPDPRIYCLAVGVFTIAAVLQAGVVLAAVGAAAAIQLACSLFLRAARPASAGRIFSTLAAGAGLIVLGLGLDALLVGLDARANAHHWTRLNNPFAHRHAPLAATVVTRDQCFDAAAILLPVGFGTTILTRRSILRGAQALCKKPVTPRPESGRG